MTDWPVVAARLALYLDLGLLFGIPLFAAPIAMWRRLHIGAWTGWLAGAGLIVSLIGFWLQMAAMLGDGLWDDPAILWEIVRTTAFGWAFLLRLAALIMALLLTLGVPSGPLKRNLLILCAACALASLAWSGHAAAGEGEAGWVHLSADMLHLLAAGAWIGALAMLLALVAPRGSVSRADVDLAHAALAGFSRAGTLIVAILVTTGALNMAFLLDLSKLPMLPHSPYGQLLLAKLALFVAMLGCAALNRFCLTPRLAAATSPAQALGHLRLSIATETLLAVLVLALVAWLGTLAPPDAL